jgi:hypothetical protein
MGNGRGMGDKEQTVGRMYREWAGGGGGRGRGLKVMKEWRGGTGRRILN